VRWMDAERQALVATFRETDPDAPTLCAGWDARRLLGHLVQREHSLWSQLMDVAAKREPGHEKHLSELVATAETPEGYEALVARFAAGTGPANPMTWFGDSVQLLEYIIHHEDVRRGVGTPEPRVLPAAEQEALWKRMPFLAKMTYRKSPVGVSLARPTGDSAVVKKGENGVVVTGDVVELALYLSGRREAAAVAITGQPQNIEAFKQWSTRSF